MNDHQHITVLFLGLLMFLLFSWSALAQTEQQAVCGFTGTGSTAATQLGGQWMSAKDTVHVLVIFVQFPDDQYDTTYSLWPTYPSLQVYPGPTYLNTYIDSLPSQLTTNGNLTHYFRQMSMGGSTVTGRFTLTGKVRFFVTPQTNQWYLNNNWNRWSINKQVLETLDASLDFSEFDRWKRYGEYDTRREVDGRVDMIFMLYRRVVGASAMEFHGGEASLGYARNYPPYNEPTEFFVDNGQRRIGHGHPVFGHPGSGTTSEIGGTGDGWFGLAPYRVQIHEFAHHWMTNGADYGHNGGGSWGMLNDWAARFNGQFIQQPNSFERELLGWIAPDSIYQTTTGVTLTDYVTTGRAVKIKVPGSNPNEFFRLEYHLKVSQFDNPEMHDPNAKGLYVIHQTGINNPRDQLRLLPSDGSWTWVSNEVVYPPYYPLGLAVYKKSGVDRINGQDDSRQVPFTWTGPPPTPNVPNPSWIHFHRDRLTNQLIEQTIFRGDGKDAWSLAKDNVFTPWSNPNSQNQARQKTWVAVEIANEIAGSGTIVLNVYIDSVACVSLPPSKPQDLRLTMANGCATWIKWARNLEPDLSGYNIYRGVLSGSGEPTYTKINSTLVTDTTYVDANYGSLVGLPRGTDLYHRYRVTSVDNQGKESVKSEYVDAFFTHIIDALVANNWNMTSIPVVVCNFAKTAVYPTATSPAYRYTSSGYVQTDTLSNNFGWWIKFGSQQTITYAGTKIDSMAMSVSTGWNIIGSISVPVETCAVTSAPAGIRSSQFFKYQNGYVLTDKLYPGAGYWVKSSQNGHLILKKGATCPPPPPPPPKDKFIVTDSEGNQQELYVVNGAISEDAESVEMPPPFAEANFDVRWGTGDFQIVVEPTGQPIELPINLNEASFPITVEWELDPENELEYVLVPPDSGGLGKSSAPQLSKTGRLNIADPTHRIQMVANSSSTPKTGVLPTEYALHQSYPNPFNPVTTMRYQLPEDGFVVLTVFDVLGRSVTTLVHEQLTAGYYSATFSGNALSSGVYFARMSVSNSFGATVYQKTSKLVLMK